MNFSAIMRSWDANWADLTTFFNYPEQIRHLIYTTNAVEAYHRMVRKFTKAKAIFPTDDSIRKVVFLSVKEIAKKWTMAARDFIGCKVTVVYDPASIEEITIEYEGYESFKARELLIGERTGTRPKLPEHLQHRPAESSRLLTAATKKNKQRKEDQAPAVSYRTVRKGGSDNV